MEGIKENLIFQKKFLLYVPLIDELLKKPLKIEMKDGDFLREILFKSSDRSEKEAKLTPEPPSKSKRTKVIKQKFNRKLSTSAFANKSRFVNTTTTLSGNGRKCPNCFRSFKNKAGYLHHKASRVDGQCCVCKAKFESKELLTAHAAQFSGKRQCCSCAQHNNPSKSKIFKNNTIFDAHIKSCHNRNKSKEKRMLHRRRWWRRKLIEMVTNRDECKTANDVRNWQRQRKVRINLIEILHWKTLEHFLFSSSKMIWHKVQSSIFIEKKTPCKEN